MIFALLALLVPIALQIPVLNSDGDLARHLGHGRYMLEHVSLIRNDPFSFTRPGASFVGFEYGSQLIYALAERIGGLPAVAVLAGVLIGATYALLARLLLKLGVDPLLASVTRCPGGGARDWALDGTPAPLLLRGRRCVARPSRAPAPYRTSAHGSPVRPLGQYSRRVPVRVDPHRALPRRQRGRAALEQ